MHITRADALSRLFRIPIFFPQAVFSTEVSMPKRTWVSAYEHHAFYYLQLPETKTLVVQSATRTPEVALGPCLRWGNM